MAVAMKGAIFWNVRQCSYSYSACT